jgi:Alkylmercury lyase
MLLFRSEEHVDRWCATWCLPKGALLTLEEGWNLARVWYGEDRRDPAWRRRTLDETEAVFAELGFTSDFWNLR